MTKRMLIDATHAEETRVVVLDGTRLEDFDVETSTKRQLKGNIYLAKVVRVEPSLQAAFVEYGGNRHGFLAFSEIHPDYYQIPIADRQRLIEMQAEDARREEEEDDLELALSQAPENSGEVRLPTDLDVGAAPEPAFESSAFTSNPSLNTTNSQAESARPTAEAPRAVAEAWANPDAPRLVAAPTEQPLTSPMAQPLAIVSERLVAAPAIFSAAVQIEDQNPAEHEGPAPNGRLAEPEGLAEPGGLAGHGAQPEHRVVVDDEPDDSDAYESNGEHIEVLPPPESVGGGDQDTGEDHRERRIPPRFLRNYKIQEVIRRRQILLVQVVKEERGTKGAALTTYLSLAGRFGVLMPNSPRGGGISRKITSATDRRRLKEVMTELDIPRGMGMIVRTAGANRPKPEIKRDCEYLLRLWDDIRESTMKSIAPALIYEEASLIKRAIRDVYSRDIDEILVDGEDGWRAAHDFMRMLMPSHAKKVQLWRDGGQPLFARNQVEAQLDGMLMPTVQLRSGGYLVINQAEALVAIDVNSGRSTRERNIEETALRTNLEAADEVARQLRLRDLAGLIVIDFIDMESKRHNAMVERRIKEALKNDRARIQVGHISHFGLLEMSRQRLRPSLAETSFISCPHCGGTGHVRSTENAAIHVLRGIEDEGGKRRSAEIVVHVSTPVALYLLNHKRERIREIELRYTMRVIIAADDAQIAPQFRIEKVRTRSPDEMPAIVAVEPAFMPAPIEEPEDEEEEAEAVGADDDDEEEETAEEQAADATGGSDEAERRKKRRRRRRRGSRRDEQQPMSATAPLDMAAMPDQVPVAHELPMSHELSASHEVTGEPTETNERVVSEAVTVVGGTDVAVSEAAGEERSEVEPSESGGVAPAGDDDAPNRRRGRRGGRRRRRENEGEMSPFAVPGADQPELQPVYAGPTPADPFGGRAFDIFDVMDQAERAAESRPSQRAPSAAEIVSDAPPPTMRPQAEERHAEPPRAVEPPTKDPEREVADRGLPDPKPSEQASHEPLPTAAEQLSVLMPEPEPPMAPQAKLVVVNTAAPTSADEVMTRVPEPEPDQPPVPANDVLAEVVLPDPPPLEPLIKPILVGADGEQPMEKKRGWWRR